MLVRDLLDMPLVSVCIALSIVVGLGLYIGEFFLDLDSFAAKAVKSFLRRRRVRPFLARRSYESDDAPIEDRDER